MLLSPSSTSFRTETCRDFSDLARHAQAWSELAWRAPQQNPTLLPAWTTAFLRHRLKRDEHWLCSFAYSCDQLVGVLPLIVAPHPILGSSHPRLRTPYGPHSPSGDVLLQTDVAKPALECLLLEVRRQVPGHLGIKLFNARQNSTIWPALESGLDGYTVVREKTHSYSVIDVTGDFDSYLKPHPNLKRNIRSYHNKLAKLGNVTFEIRTDGFATGAFETFLALEGGGWKGRTGSPIIKDDRVRAFFEDLARTLGAEGHWEWHILRVDERVVAAGMGVRCGSSLMLPKIAFDEELADCRPGAALTAEVIKAAFADDSLSEINHMSNASWHDVWHMSKEVYAGVDLIRSNATGALVHLPHVLLTAVFRDAIRPNIPVAVKKARRRFKRRGDGKPQRAAKSRQAPLA